MRLRHRLGLWAAVGLLLASVLVGCGAQASRRVSASGAPTARTASARPAATATPGPLTSTRAAVASSILHRGPTRTSRTVPSATATSPARSAPAPVPATASPGWRPGQDLTVGTCSLRHLTVTSRSALVSGDYSHERVGNLDGVPFTLTWRGSASAFRLSVGGYALPVCSLSGHPTQFESVTVGHVLYVYGLVKLTGGEEWFINNRRPNVLVDLTTPAGDFFVAQMARGVCGSLAAPRHVALSIEPPGAKSGTGSMSTAVFTRGCQWASALAAGTNAGAAGATSSGAVSGQVSSANPAGGQPTVQIAPPAGLDATQETTFAHGELVFSRAGCLGCHQLAQSGNSGPGSDLDGLGNRLGPAQITQALLRPEAPMPAYTQMPAAPLHALVSFLSELR